MVCKGVCVRFERLREREHMVRVKSKNVAAAVASGDAGTLDFKRNIIVLASPVSKVDHHCR